MGIDVDVGSGRPNVWCSVEGETNEMMPEAVKIVPRR